MKRLFFFIPIIVLIIATTLTKNSTKKLDKEIFQLKENIRILVNKEISELINALVNSFNLIPIGGIIAVVTFHSIEDKIVKFFFKHYSEQRNSSRGVSLL